MWLAHTTPRMQTHSVSMNLSSLNSITPSPSLLPRDHEDEKMAEELMDETVGDRRCKINRRSAKAKDFAFELNELRRIPLRCICDVDNSQGQLQGGALCLFSVLALKDQGRRS